MKTADLRNKTKDELDQELLNARKEQFNFRFQKSTGQLENTGSIRTTRRNIAKIKTVQNEQKSGKAPAAKPAKAKADKAAAPKKKKTKE